MTEYWKSYSKKFCEICKVWYADNKISSERHETGAGHKVMVQQRLRESAKKAKDKQLKDHDLRMTLLSMEQAAKSSMSSKNQKTLPSMHEEFSEGITSCSEKSSEKADLREELREQKRKLDELKKSAKRSQFWVDDQPEEEEKQLESDEVDGVLCWVQGVTATGLRYYWHIFSGETRWDQPKRFYTAEEYAEKYTEIATKITAKNQSLINSGNISNDFERNEAIAPNSAPQLLIKSNEQITSRERPAKKEQSKKERKRRWDTNEESKIPEELIINKIEPKPELIQSTEIINSNVANMNIPSGHPYGPWVPVKKEIPKPEPEKPPEKPKKRYDDLPEQHYGPGTSTIIPEELLEVALIDKEELSFKQKQMPEKKKNVKNIVGFRKPGNLGNKSLRNTKI
ncbi:hypothetical protein ACQ4LE_006040 [Meloidogyne hapla]|uniref:WW domain-containing protein n=1 Tax=Meloidogyne hapla TaxID=6305 RepID=A0A1I8BJR6_MELHA